MKLLIVRLNKKKRDLLVFNDLVLALKLWFYLLSLAECQNLCIFCVYCLAGDLFAEYVCRKEQYSCCKAIQSKFTE